MCLNYMNNTDSKQLLTNTLSKVLSCHFSPSIQILCWKAVKIFISRKHLLLLFKKMNCLIKITILVNRKKQQMQKKPKQPKNKKATNKPTKTQHAFQREFLIKMKFVEYIVQIKSVGLVKCSKLSMGLCTCLIWVLNKKIICGLNCSFWSLWLGATMFWHSCEWLHSYQHSQHKNAKYLMKLFQVKACFLWQNLIRWEKNRVASMQTFEEGAFELLFVTNAESKWKQELGEAGD